MKAILNKKFDILLKVVRRLWQQRNKIRNLTFEDIGFDYPDYFGCKEAGSLSGNVIDAIQESFFRLSNKEFSTRNQFLKDILASPSFSFYDEFVKKIV